MVAKDRNIIHGSNGEGSTGAVDHEVHRVTSAVRIPHDLAKDVIEDIYSSRISLRFFNVKFIRDKLPEILLNLR